MIYLIEDDSNIRELVVYTLNSTGLPAQGFAVPSLFWKQMQQQKPDLILLDIMLPEQDKVGFLLLHLFPKQ
ncbi:MAG: response regulator [Clostridia bacterium]|nr:response regulator [Clostridia bacterium]